MDKIQLIDKLNRDFNIRNYHDVWNNFKDYIKNIQQHICSDFHEYSNGLMVDFTDNVNEFVIATFLTENLFAFIKENNKTDLLIFTHHPFFQKTLDYTWHDAISNNMGVLRKNRIAIYVAHMALDFHSEYSTGLYLAKELMSKIEGRLSYKYDGVADNVECECVGICVDNILDKVSQLSERPVFYQFNNTPPKRICCSPGGGNIIEIITMAKEQGVDTYITGISEFRGKHSVERNKAYFEQLQNIGINIVGLGHYETECLAMRGLVRDYFEGLNQPVTYFEDNYYR